MTRRKKKTMLPVKRCAKESSPKALVPPPARAGRFAALAAIAFSLMLPVACRSLEQPAPPRDPPDLEAMIDEIMSACDRPDAPGAAVAVVEKGNVVFAKGYGLASLEHGIPITPATVFHIASVSKQFTVFAVLLLAEQGRLSLDDDVRAHVPEVPDFGPTITLRHLATHTSGLRDQWDLLTTAGWRMDDVIDREQILGLVSRQQDLNFPPGEEYSYSNTGFTLLAEVVARVSGQSFPEFVEEHVFEPLGMRDSCFRDDHEAVVRRLASSYRPEDDGLKKSVLSYATVGATSLLTTVEDLGSWALNFRSPRVGSAEIIEEMSTPARLNSGRETEGALGQFVREHKGLKLIDHGGADAGYRTYFGRFPDEDLAVIMLGNTAAADLGLARQVADLFLKDRIADAPEDEAALAAPPGERIAPDERTLERYEGIYEHTELAGLLYTLTKEGTRLLFEYSGHAPRALTPVSTDIFVSNDDSIRVGFTADAGGKARALRLRIGSRSMEATRIADIVPSPSKLAEYAGEYYSAELLTRYVLTVRDGRLTAGHYRLSDFALVPTGEDTFAGNYRNLARVVFERDAGGAITGFTNTSGRVRNLRFERAEPRAADAGGPGSSGTPSGQDRRKR